MENENVAPAGETTTAAVSNEPEAVSSEPVTLTLDQAVALEDAADSVSDKPRDPNGRFLKKDGDGEPEGEPEPQDDEGQSAEAPEAGNDGNDESIVDGNYETRLRDGRKVKIAELKKAYDEAEQIRQAAPEIQKYAEALQEQARQIAAQRAEFEQLISQVQLPQNAIPQPPSMELLQVDPIAYVQQKEQYEAAVRVQQFQQQQHAQMLQQKNQQAQVRLQEHMQRQAEMLVKAVPELKDKKAAQAFQTQFMEVAKSYGFNEQEAANVYDHRLLVMVRDLARLKKLESGAPEMIEQAKQRARGVRPGEANATARVPANARNAQNIQALRERAKRTGSLDDVLRLENALNS